MHNSPIRVSVIVPIYNCEKYLDRCLTSLMKVNFTDIEYILVNDGSVDGSRALCEFYVRKDKRFKIIDKENGGVSSARNAGVGQAQGRWITFVDGDDMIFSEAYDWIIHFLAADQDAEMLLMDISEAESEENTSEESVVPRKLDAEERRILKIGIFNLDYREYQCYKETVMSSPCAKFYRADIIQENNIRFYEDVEIGEDRLFNYEYILRVNQIYYWQKKVYYYIQNPGSVMHKYIEGKGLKFLTSVERFADIVDQEDWGYLALYGVRQYISALKIDYCNLNNTKSYSERRKDSEKFLKNSLIEKCFKLANLKELKKVATVMAVLSKIGAFGICSVLWRVKERLHIKFK